MGKLGHIDMSSVTNSRVQVLYDRATRTREQPSDTFDHITTGLRAHEFLIAMVQGSRVGQLSLQYQMPPQTNNLDEYLVHEGYITQNEAREMPSQISKYVVGSEGYSLYKKGIFWLPDDDAAHKV
jgi:hypothetical protein